MTTRKAPPVLAAGAAAILLLCAASAGCGSSASPGPLGGMAPGDGMCWGPHRGSVLSITMYINNNNTSSPLTLTGAWLTGTRDLTVDGVYADILPAHDALGAMYGYLPKSMQNPVNGTAVPPGDGFEVIFTITARSAAALASGEQVTYTYQGQSYETGGHWSAGMKPGC